MSHSMPKSFTSIPIPRPEPGFMTGRDYASEKSLTGNVTRLFCERDDWCAGVISDPTGDPLFKDCKFSVKDHVSLGERVTLVGAWEDGKYGWQFVASHISYPAPDMRVEGLAHYLATESEFRGLGPVKARLLAETFGPDFDRAIRKDLERVAEVGKLSMDQAIQLQSVWCERQDINDISAWLGEYGLTAGQIRKIAKAFGNSARLTLTSNPYVLHRKIDGIGFLRNDEIALKMGVPTLSPDRIRAAISYYVDDAHESSGHTYIPKGELINSLIKNLYLDSLDAAKIIAEQIDYLATDAGGCVLRCADVDGHAYVGSSQLYLDELYLGTALRIAKCMAIPAVDYSSVDPAAVGLDKLTDEQRQAVDSALSNPVSIITGGAGTGKSHTIKRIVETLRMLDHSCAIAAPTGKAARRLQQDGLDAQTIHRLLEYSPRGGGFQRNAQNPIDVACVIIDEGSMCAIPLYVALIRAIDSSKTRLVIVGDYNQLPPIGPGNTLRDFVDNELVPVTRLTKCHRNAGKLKANCIAVLSGQLVKQGATIDHSQNPSDKQLQSLPANTPAWSVITDGENAERVVELCRILQSSQFAAWGYDPVMDCQIITPQNPGPLGVNRLNLELQRVEQAKRKNYLPPVTAHNARYEYFIGDKVMQVKNDYNLGAWGVMNGTQGVVVDIVEDVDPANINTRDEDRLYTWLCVQFEDREPGTLVRVRKDQNNLTLGYAVTCHKVQGSQYPCVVSIMHRSHTWMLSRNLCYTAVSRARYTSIVLGEATGMNRAARTVTNMNRRTWTALYCEKSRRESEAMTDDAYGDGGSK